MRNQGSIIAKSLEGRSQCDLPCAPTERVEKKALTQSPRIVRAINETIFGLFCLR